MKRLFWLLLIGALLLGIIAATLPARVALRLVPAGMLPVQLDEVSGSIWSGRAERVLRGDAELGRLEWKLHPWSLLRGQIDADLRLQGAELDGSGRIRVAGAGDLRVEGARLRLPASRLDRLLDIPTLSMTGRVELELDALELRGRVPVALKGKANWREAGVSGSEQAVFGTLLAEFGALPDGGFGGSVRDSGEGPLALEGQFRTVLMGYEGRATLRAREDNPQLQSALDRIGQRQPDGSVVYEVKGGLMGQGS